MNGRLHMTGKELIFQTLRHEPTPRAPWVPFAGVHAGALVGATATQVLTDEETLVRALLEVNRLYKPDGQPVVFDLQLEAEVLGCGLVWADDCPPSVSSHPLADTMTVPCRCTLPTAESGRMPMVLSAMRRMKEAVGDTTALYGLLCGPFTLASHLRGNDIFMDMFDDEDYVKELLDFCADCAKRMSDLYLDAGMDVVAVVDPLVSQISSDHFEEFLSAPYTELFRYLREEKQAFSSFFVCGNATRNIEVMCRTAPDSISVDENVDILAAKAICDKYNVAIGGNIPLTSIPDCGLSTDIFSGFHSETEEDHQMSLSLMRECAYDSAFMFKYSERPGTYASKHLPDDVPEEVKIRRLNEMIELQNQLSAESNARDVGKTFEVLVEGVSKRSKEQLFGRTEQNKVVVFDRGTHRIGDLVRVRITESSSATLKGIEVTE